MTQIQSDTNAINDRIQMPFSFDVNRLQQEIEALQLTDFIYYSVHPLTFPRKKEKNTDVADYADGSWADWNDTKELLESPCLLNIVNTFREKTKVTLVRLLRLAPGAVIKEHTDPTLGIHVPNSVIRLTIPIISGDDVAFFLNRKKVDMKPGECWYLRLSDPHQIINNSSMVRINMSIDMIPNNWVRTMIRDQQELQS